MTTLGPLPTPTEPDFLWVDDHKRLDAFVQECLQYPGLPADRRRNFMIQLARLVDADRWLWVHSVCRDGERRPRNFQYIGDNLASVRTAFQMTIRHYDLDEGGRSPENTVIATLIRQRWPFSRSLEELVDDDTADDPLRRRYERERLRLYNARIGIDHQTFYIHPLDGPGNDIEFAGTIFSRHAGRPPFTGKQLETLDAVQFKAFPVLSHHLNVSPTRKAIVLSYAEQLIYVCLRVAKSCQISAERVPTHRDIAGIINRSTTTVKAAASRIFKRIGGRDT